MNNDQKELFKTLYPHADIHSVSDSTLITFFNQDYIINTEDEIRVMEYLYDYLLSQDLISITL